MAAQPPKPGSDGSVEVPPRSSESPVPRPQSRGGKPSNSSLTSSSDLLQSYYAARVAADEPEASRQRREPDAPVSPAGGSPQPGAVVPAAASSESSAELKRRQAAAKEVESLKAAVQRLESERNEARKEAHRLRAELQALKDGQEKRDREVAEDMQSLQSQIARLKASIASGGGGEVAAVPASVVAAAAAAALVRSTGDLSASSPDKRVTDLTRENALLKDEVRQLRAQLMHEAQFELQGPSDLGVRPDSKGDVPAAASSASASSQSPPSLPPGESDPAAGPGSAAAFFHSGSGSDLVPVNEVLYENERYVLGWRNPALPTDRPHFSDESGRKKLGFDEVELPAGWRWATNWKIDTSGDVDEEGWEYAKDFRMFSWHRRNEALDAVRRRRWIRLREKIPEFELPGGDEFDW